MKKLRYYKYQKLLNKNFYSSHSVFQRHVKIELKRLDLRLGLFKSDPQLIYHHILSMILTGQPPILKYQFHGKRQRRTVSLDTNLLHFFAWSFIERLLNELIPKMYDIKTVKHRRSISPINSYTLRIRERISFVEEIDDLVESFMLDTHKGIYLPMTTHFQLLQVVDHFVGETLIRAFRIPIHFYKKHSKPAFDDTIKISIEEAFGIKLVY